MKVKAVQYPNWNLELVPIWVNIETEIDWNTRQLSKKVIEILEVESEDFEKSINCSKKERNDLIFNLLWKPTN